MLQKYATFEVLSTLLVPQEATTVQLRSLAHRHHFQYDVEPGYLYVRSRAISSRCNDNYDEFSAPEIKKAYKTFIGKPVFVNHSNENHRRARGVVIDAALHEDRNPDGSPDTWVEALMMVDAIRFPKLAQAIIAGHIDRTSMGTDVAFSICSACDNKATSPSEYCQHIPKMKGQRLYRHNAKTGKKEGILIREKCYGLGFFENSLLVEEPADPTAHMWGLDTRGIDKAAARSPKPSWIKRSEPSEDAASWSSTGEHESDAGPNGGCSATDEQGRSCVYTHGHNSQFQHRFAVRRMATWIGDHPDEPSLYWRSPNMRHEVHIKNRMPSRDFRENYGVKPSQEVELHEHDVAAFQQGHKSRPNIRTLDSDGDLGPGAFGNSKPPAHVMKHLHRALEQVNQHAEDHADLHGQMAEQDDMAHDQRQVPKDMAAEEKSKRMLDNMLNQAGPLDDLHNKKDDDDDPLSKNKIGPTKWSSKIAARRPAHMEEHYVGLTNRVGGIHAVHPDDYHLEDKTGGWAKARCGASVSVEHGYDNNPMTYGSDEGYDQPSCLRCSRSIGSGKKTSGLMEVVSFFSLAAPRKPKKDKEPPKPKEPTAADHFFAAHPPDAHNIVNRVLATHKEHPEMYDSGKNWYEDSHHVNKALGNGDVSKAAGLCGVYSAGTAVAPNYHYVSRSIIHKKGVGGKQGANSPAKEHCDFHGHPCASQAQASQADRILAGEHHSKVLQSPKVSNYAHLIEHAGNEPGAERHRVVIDRHAVSAAVGHRVTDKEFGSLNLSDNQNGKKNMATGEIRDHGTDMNPRYQHLADTYREATHILKGMGHDLNPHQVQAIAWLHQKAENDTADAAHVEAEGPQAGNIKGRQKSQERQRDAWKEHYKNEHNDTHMPQYPQHHWGRRKTAFGETVAPVDVDTLRDEECPVCGETSSSFDGKTCQVCGFDAPPVMFRDPDLEKARNIDLRKDVIDDGSGGLTPDQQDANGGMPGEVPGQGVPGSDQMPVDPSMLDENGQPLPGAEPQPVLPPEEIIQQQMEQLQSGMPLTPEMLGPDGEVVPPQQGPGGPSDPEMPEGVGVPQEPLGPMGPEGPQGVVDPTGLDEEGNQTPLEDPQEGAGALEPQDLDEDGNPQASDGQEAIQEPDAGDPGTPVDGVADLVCPACGFASDAQQPTSTDMAESAIPAGDGDGSLAGDVCPNCGQAAMMSVGEMEQTQGPPV